MISSNFPNVYVIHYTKLKERRQFLEKSLIDQKIQPTWITETTLSDFKQEIPAGGKIVGVNEKLVGMDLGINSRSISKSRQRARIEGRILFLRSYLTRNNTLTTGSLPSKNKLKGEWLELQRMHLTALKIGILTDANWILVLEDDAVPTKDAFQKIEEIIKKVKPKNTWINLNSGAGLIRTKSEKKIDENGLFEVKPPATRCAVAYLISNDLAKKFVIAATFDGIPNWLPIDYYFQVLLRKFRAKSYWIDPIIFEQGSESGQFKSAFEELRT